MRNISKKRVIALALVLMMLIPLAPLSVLAAPGDLPDLRDLKTGTWTEEEKDALIQEVIDELTLEEKVDLLAGTYNRMYKNQAVAGGTFTSARLMEMGIAPMSLSDGPAGMKMDEYKATGWSSPTSLAATWNMDYVYSVGKQTGAEAAFWGADYLLGPAHDLIRNPLSGRNFEYYSEDPLVSGKTAAAYAQGVQSEGVGATLKHFAANEQESFQNGGGNSLTNLNGNTGGGNAIISERALRELYLKSFEIAVKEGDPWAIMASYVTINDVPSHNNPWLLTEVLREDWGFDGLVMSDWDGNQDILMALEAQMDLSMPSYRDSENGETMGQRDILIDAVTNRGFSEELLDRSVRNVLNAIVKSNVFNDKYGEWGVPYDLNQLHEDFYESAVAAESAKLAREVAAESMVLLKNDGVLPLAADEKVGVVSSPNLRYYAGWGTYISSTPDFVIRGAGSSGAYVGNASPEDPYYDTHPIRSFEDVLTSRGHLAGTVQDIYEAAGRTKTVTYYSNNSRGIMTHENRDYSDLPINYVANLNTSAQEMADTADYGVMLISRQTGEGYDNIPAAAEETTQYEAGNNNTSNASVISKSYYLSTVEEAAVKAYADALHAAGKPFIVLLNVGAAIDTTIIDQYADAILVVWLPGQEGADAMADVLYGEVNPSGKLPQTFIKDFWTSPSVAAAMALRDQGIVRDNLLYKTSHQDYDTNGGWASNPVFYDEGVLMGYRWYDTKFQTREEYDAQVAYSFGYGMSYTDFAFSNLRLSSGVFDADDPEATITATVNVKNVGDVAGKEVVQMYLGMHDYAAEGRPMKDLRGFDKVELQPGEDTDVTFTITLEDLQYFDDGQPEDKVLVGSPITYKTEPQGDASNVTYGEGEGWTVNLNSTFDVIIGNTSNNFDLEESGVKGTFVYTDEYATVTGSAYQGGTVDEAVQVAIGGDARVGVRADEGSKLVAILVDGVTQDISKLEDDVFVIENVERDMELRALFVKDQEEDFAAVYNDVDDDWYYDSIDMLTGLNILEGKGDGTFDPGEQIRRSEFTKLMYAMAGALGVDTEEIDAVPFSDVTANSHWAMGYIGWAYENGLVEGYDEDTFGPEDPIIRQDMALFMMRFFDEHQKYDLPGARTKAFTDADEIGEYAQNAVNYVVRTGLMEGHANGEFGPLENTQRSHVSKVIFNYLIYTD